MEARPNRRTLFTRTKGKRGFPSRHFFPRSSKKPARDAEDTQPEEKQPQQKRSTLKSIRKRLFPSKAPEVKTKRGNSNGLEEETLATNEQPATVAAMPTPKTKNSTNSSSDGASYTPRLSAQSPDDHDLKKTNSYEHYEEEKEEPQLSNEEQKAGILYRYNQRLAKITAQNKEQLDEANKQYEHDIIKLILSYLIDPASCHRDSEILYQGLTPKQLETQQISKFQNNIHTNFCEAVLQGNLDAVLALIDLCTDQYLKGYKAELWHFIFGLYQNEHIFISLVKKATSSLAEALTHNPKLAINSVQSLENHVIQQTGIIDGIPVWKSYLSILSRLLPLFQKSYHLRTSAQKSNDDIDNGYYQISCKLLQLTKDENDKPLDVSALELITNFILKKAPCNLLEAVSKAEETANSITFESVMHTAIKTNNTLLTDRLLHYHHSNENSAELTNLGYSSDPYGHTGQGIQLALAQRNPRMVSCILPALHENGESLPLFRSRFSLFHSTGRHIRHYPKQGNTDSLYFLKLHARYGRFITAIQEVNPDNNTLYKNSSEQHYENTLRLFKNYAMTNTTMQHHFKRHFVPQIKTIITEENINPIKETKVLLQKIIATCELTAEQLQVSNSTSSLVRRIHYAARIARVDLNELIKSCTISTTENHSSSGTYSKTSPG